MFSPAPPSDPTRRAGAHRTSGPGVPLALSVTLSVPDNGLTLEWLDPATGAAVACGHVRPSESNVLGHVLRLTLQDRGEQDSFACLAWPNSVRALIQRIRKRFPVADGHLTIDLLTDIDLGRAVAGRRLPILPPGADGWDWLNRTVLEVARLLGSGRYLGDGPSAQGKTAMRLLACVLLGVPVNLSGTAVASRHKTGAYQLRVTFDTVQMLVDFSWTHRSDQALNAKGRVRSLGGAQLNWELQTNGKTEVSITSPRRNPIHAALLEWQNRFP